MNVTVDYSSSQPPSIDDKLPCLLEINTATGNNQDNPGHVSIGEPAIRFYCGINEQEWNRCPVTPGPLACISPVKGRSERTRCENRVTVPRQTSVIQDSGAFCDGWHQRVSFREALDRQKRHADKFGYADSITHRATYDVLIDEIWTDGNRTKRRWSETDANAAVLETINAAAFMHKNRSYIGNVVSAQGVTPSQYMECARGVLPFVTEKDIFGLGGWCIIGKMRRIMMPTFRETMTRLIPFLGSEGVRRVHIWGVIMPDALGELLWLCDQQGIALSTDSAGPTLNPVFGEWGYGDWRDNDYQVPSLETRGAERTRHVALTRQWLGNFRETRYYRPAPASQLTFWVNEIP